MQQPGRDRLRELLDAVLAGADEGVPRSLDEMAGEAYSSPFHFSRLLSRNAGEPPVAMRRRVMLERAAWQLRQGSTVTDAAWAAGYESVDGFTRAFTRAFGHPPSLPAGSHWLPAPNGIHYHPPMSLWVHSTENTMSPLTEQLVSHDLDDTRDLLEIAKGLPEAELRAERLPFPTVTSWEGPERSIAAVLEHHIWTKEVWLAAIEGLDLPPRDENDGVARLLERHDATAGRWLAVVRDIEARGAWNDRLIDALCDPPESFVLSSVVAHIVTYAAHRRQLVRHLLRAAGREVDDGDPIMWLRAVRGETEHDPAGRPGDETDDDTTTGTEGNDR
ncbi:MULTISPECIES: helix-turn-helix domain-containing protein [Pseudofrankia]|uniref:helix-turn-helix domain-containing protein n=1 Tax=Pseudofrankia TaxID=2994363 RepID=UPI000234D86C|nr:MULTISPECIES: helix-turn-helix domain-containing protein [Pseudofrankia]